MTNRQRDTVLAAIGVQRWLFLFYLMFVIYGSLVPLDYQARPFDEAWAVLLGLRDKPLSFSSRTDWATNLMLFVPLTFLAGQSFASRASNTGRVVIGVMLAVAASALAIAIEFAQIYFPTRTPSQNDIVALSISGVIGVIAHWIFGLRVTVWAAGYWQNQQQTEKISRVLKGYLFVLFAFSVLPLDLTISPVEIYHKWTGGRVILLPFGGLKGGIADMLYQVLTDVLIWVPAGVLWAMQQGHSMARVVRKGLLAALVIECLQLFVFSRTTDITTVLLAGVGCAAGVALRQRFAVSEPGGTNRGASNLGHTRPHPHHSGVSGTSPKLWAMLWLLWVGAVLAAFWFPFGFDLRLWSETAALEALTRTPLSTYYANSEFLAVNELLRKIGFFIPGGALLGLARQAGHQRVMRTTWWPYALLALVAFAVETGQLLLPGKVSDVTDFLIESFGGALGYWMASWIVRAAAREPTRQVEASAPTVSNPTPPASQTGALPNAPRLPTLSRNWQFGYWLLVVAAAAHSWLLCTTANIGLGNSLLILAAVLAMAGVPRFTWLGPAAYVVAAYGIARYSEDYEALLRSGVLNWLLALAVIGWLVAVRSGRSQPHFRGWLVWNTVLLALWACVCVLAAWSRATSFSFATMLHPAQFVHGWVLMLLAAQVLGHRQADWGFGFALGCTVVLRALMQGRSGIYLEADIAALCVMTLPIALFGMLAARPLWLRYAFGALGAAMLATFALAQNRGAAVGLTLALLCIWWNTRHRVRWALAAIPLLALAIFLAPTTYIDRFRVVFDPTANTATAGLDRATVAERKELWDTASTIFADNPWVGVGPGNSIDALKLYRPGHSRIRIHNTFIDAGIETGVVGFVLFTVLIFGAIFLLQRRMWRGQQNGAEPTLRAVQAALAAYVGACFFISRYDMQLAYLLVGWAAALVRRKAGQPYEWQMVSGARRTRTAPLARSGSSNQEPRVTSPGIPSAG